MSHVTEMKQRIRNLEDLKEACTALGLEFREGQTRFAWWGRFQGDSHDYGEMQPKDMGKCLHAIGIPGQKGADGSAGPWEIGVVAAKDGDGYKLFYDTFGSAGRALTERAGVGCSRLVQQTGVATSRRSMLAELARHGFRAVADEPLQDGSVRVAMVRR